MNSTLSNPTNWLIRKPLLAFFVLSYALFWVFLVSIGIVSGMSQVSLATLPAWVMSIIAIIGSWMPNLAAAIVTGASEGQNGIRRLFGKFLQFRFSATWYLAALLPLGLALTAGILYTLFGNAPGNNGLSLSFWLGLVFINLIQGATGEEAGWRGFALPRLKEKHGNIKASLILGLLWSFWHLPLWLTSGFSGTDLLVYLLGFNIGIISLTFLMTWVSSHVPNSLVPMVILHFCFNAGLNLVDPRGLGLGPTLTLLGIMAGLQMLFVGILVGTGQFSNPQEKTASF